MPLWSEYKETAQARGALAMELFMVQSMPASDPQTMQRILPDHLAYQKKMEVAGSLVMAGPISDESGDQMIGAGLIIYRAENFAVAKLIAENDPMHAAGARTYTIRKWLVNEGSITLSVRLSEQSMEIS